MATWNDVSGRFVGLDPEEAPFGASQSSQSSSPSQPEREHAYDRADATHSIAGSSSDPLTRMEAVRRAVESIGIEWPKTIVPEGSALISVGVDKLKRDRAAWDRMPLVKDALPVVKAALEMEARVDYEESVQDLAIRPSDGRLVRRTTLTASGGSISNKPGLAYTDHALRQLLGQAGILSGAPKGFAAALSYINNRERAEIFNRLVLEADPAKKTVLRTKLPHEGQARVVRAALSERYGDANDLHVAEILGYIQSQIPDGAKLSYLPGDTASRFEVVFPSKIEIPQVKAGDLHKAGIYLRNSETGQGGFTSKAGITRILCVNLTRAERFGESASIRHVGAGFKVRDQVRDSVLSALRGMEPLLEVIGYSATIKVESEIESVMKRIAARFGEGKSAAESWTKMHKEAQYPSTVWGITAAITEAAHAKSSWTLEEDWERIGSWVTDGAVKVKKEDPAKSWLSFLDMPAPFGEEIVAAANRQRLSN